jgi:tripeptide aminopeptidase
MIQISEENLAERMMRYARIDTQSDPASDTHPSTEKQKELSKLLLRELWGMGITRAETDAYGYVYADDPFQ